MCCRTMIEIADQPYYLTQSQYSDTWPTSPSTDPGRLGGLVVKAYASRTDDPGFEFRLRRDFPGVSAGTGRPGVSIM